MEYKCWIQKITKQVWRGLRIKDSKIQTQIEFCGFFLSILAIKSDFSLKVLNYFLFSVSRRNRSTTQIDLRENIIR